MAPHFGLLDEDKVSRKEAMQMRSKLHWRCGKRRIIENKNVAGVATLYDAILSAMRWYLYNNRYDELGDDVEKTLENDQIVISLVEKAGIIDNSVDIKFISSVVDKALLDKDVSMYKDKFFQQAELLLTKLKLLPFDESKLPPEDPNTF